MRQERRCGSRADDEGPAGAGRQRDDRPRRRRPPGAADRRREGRDGAAWPSWWPADIDVVVTHGNGPQVGNLLVKNEIAASVVPPVPLDWCGAQTQATLGFVLMNALDDALRERGVQRRTCHRRDPRARRRARPGLRQADASRSAATCPSDEAALLVEHGETWEDRGEQGWRRVVASPEPREILDAAAVHALVEAGFVVVANGGGGIPVVREATAGCAASRRSSTRTSARPCWPGPSRPTCSSSPPTCRTRCCASARPRPRTDRPRSTSRSCARTPPRGTSPAARWVRRSTRPAGSSSSGGTRAVITDLATHPGTPSPATTGTVVVTHRHEGGAPMPDADRRPQGPDPHRVRRQRARRR